MSWTCLGRKILACSSVSLWSCDSPAFGTGSQLSFSQINMDTFAQDLPLPRHSPAAPLQQKWISRT